MGDYTYDAMFKCRSIQVFINLSMLNIFGEKLNIYAIHGKVSCLNVATNPFKVRDTIYTSVHISDITQICWIISSFLFEN